ncbi:hypothetical protein, partial [Methanocalculus sp. AMF5]
AYLFNPAHSASQHPGNLRDIITALQDNTIRTPVIYRLLIDLIMVRKIPPDWPSFHFGYQRAGSEPETLCRQGQGTPLLRQKNP